MTYIYIAGPMTGIPEFNYPAFQDAADRLNQHENVTALNPAVHDISGDIKPWDYYMRKALTMLLLADAVALLPGWENSTGATLEHHVATALKLDIRPLAEWTS